MTSARATSCDAACTFAVGERPSASRKPAHRGGVAGRREHRGYVARIALARARGQGRPHPALNGCSPERPTDDANTNATRRDAATPAYPPRRPRGPHPGTQFHYQSNFANTHTTVVSTQRDPAMFAENIAAILADHHTTVLCVGPEAP
jgi:hypothetical protein